MENERSQQTALAAIVMSFLSSLVNLRMADAESAAVQRLSKLLKEKGKSKVEFEDLLNRKNQAETEPAYDPNYPDQGVLGARLAKRLNAPTYLERLLMQKEETEDRLKKINDVIEALKRNPEIAVVVETMSKLHI